jgi:hypothetical protein
MERIRLLLTVGIGIDFALELPPGLLLLLFVLIMSSELMLTLLVVKNSPEVETDPFWVEIDLRNVKSSLVPQMRTDASPEHVISLVLIHEQLSLVQQNFETLSKIYLSTNINNRQEIYIIVGSVYIHSKCTKRIYKLILYEEGK